jgi:hypothetical protein
MLSMTLQEAMCSSFAVINDSWVSKWWQLVHVLLVACMTTQLKVTASTATSEKCLQSVYKTAAL